MSSSIHSVFFFIYIYISGVKLPSHGEEQTWRSGLVVQPKVSADVSVSAGHQSEGGHSGGVLWSHAEPDRFKEPCMYTYRKHTQLNLIYKKLFNLYFDLCTVVHSDESKHHTEAARPVCHFTPAEIRKPWPTEDRHVLSGQHVPGVISAGHYG